MEVKNIYKHSGWFLSYIEDDCARALMRCQHRKIIQLNRLLETIKSEIELAKDPIEESPITVLNSIEALIESIEKEIIEHTEGYFKWTEDSKI